MSIEQSIPAQRLDTTGDAGQVGIGPHTPVPIAGPVVGIAAACLSALGGLWLVLAPFALGYQAHADSLSRAAVVDITCGAVALLAAVATAASFGATVRGRLRAAGVLPGRRAAGTPPAEEQADGPGQVEPDEPATAPYPEPSTEASAGELRDLLAPLVAALAADLRARDEAYQEPTNGTGRTGEP